MRPGRLAPFFVSTCRGLRRSIVLAAIGVAALACPAFADGEMTFEAVSVGGSAAISATGRITEGTPQAFLAFLQRTGLAGAHPVVYLDSPGGGVIASMQFGTMMRRVGATAIVGHASSGFFGGSGASSAQCFSACVYALMGASRRIVPSGSEVGIHGMFLSVDGYGDVTAYASRQERSAVGGLRAMLSSYSARMGVSPELIFRAEHVPSDNLHILSRAEIRKWRLAVATP